MGVVPDKAEHGADLLNQPGRGRPSPAVLKGRQVRRRNFQTTSHGAERDIPLGTKRTKFGAERGHDGRDGPKDRKFLAERQLSASLAPGKQAESPDPRPRSITTATGTASPP